MELQNAGASATILAMTTWALVLATSATASSAFRHPPELDAPASGTHAIVS